MAQELSPIKLASNLFRSFRGRLVFILIAESDFCTRAELTKWTNCSNLTISRYIQNFGRAGLIGNAPGIVFLSDFGEEVFESLKDMFITEIGVVRKIIQNKDSPNNK